MDGSACLRRLERVVSREMDVEEEDAALVRRLLLLAPRGRGEGKQVRRRAAGEGGSPGAETRISAASLALRGGGGWGPRTGPMIVDCQWKRSSPTGPALQEVGGSLVRSCSSLLIRLHADIAGLAVGGEPASEVTRRGVSRGRANCAFCRQVRARWETSGGTHKLSAARAAGRRGVLGRAL